MWCRTIVMMYREGNRRRQPWPVLTEFFLQQCKKLSAIMIGIHDHLPAETVVMYKCNMFSKYEQ
jgi:hypothetical protein